MPIENSYRNSKEKFTVNEVSEKYHQSFETIIVTFQSKVLQGLLDSKFIIEIPDRKFGTSNSKYPIYKLTKQENVLFYLSPIGAPATVGILEEIIYAFDVKNIIMYGSCGVLDRKIAAGKIIVPTKAYRDEGTSYHYQPSSEFIDLKENSFVSSVLKNNGIDFVKGYTWTTDAFYRETEELYRERKNQGCIAVEMEISAVQAFVNLRNIKLYSFIYGGDNLDSSKWDKRILGNLSVDERVKYFLVASIIASKI
ncbi:MAG: nucleoside phosphorylase [Bacilli bacterium]|jgi:uridine phosphorylase|nr:nucleoside phosphorylase [Bacilli bacterium]MDD3121731.1 nucleoside phosphorylase [Bacilli bacterium]MDD4063547.1 nucleoside phosphorylase [Bacilli bacterium]MDD4482476.1 nucleoside phosphorylase [Bacilli bacterium]MDD5183608.1 nucleoside phosphorylase [Bacilli bacterium]